MMHRLGLGKDGHIHSHPAEKVERFGVSIAKSLLKPFDVVIKKKGYASRSEALRDLIREHLMDEAIMDGGEAVGVLSLVYDHEVRALGEKLTHISHHHVKEIISTTHVHLDERNCLEVILIKGKSDKIKAFADQMIATKGVKHGKLMLTTQNAGE
jgi:CopG family nickel-responsive transcriptional regulator